MPEVKRPVRMFFAELPGNRIIKVIRGRERPFLKDFFRGIFEGKITIIPIAAGFVGDPLVPCSLGRIHDKPGNFRMQTRAGVCGVDPAKIDAEPTEQAFFVVLGEPKVLLQPEMDSGIVEIMDGHPVGFLVVECAQDALAGG
jgi:hypothetical protein